MRSPCFIQFILAFFICSSYLQGGILMEWLRIRFSITVNGSTHAFAYCHSGVWCNCSVNIWRAVIFWCVDNWFFCDEPAHRMNRMISNKIDSNIWENLKNTIETILLMSLLDRKDCKRIGRRKNKSSWWRNKTLKSSKYVKYFIDIMKSHIRLLHNDLLQDL